MNAEILLNEFEPVLPSKRAWWNTVAALGCIVTRQPGPTIHHIHSGSVGDIGVHGGVAIRGVNDYLVIPLKAELHCAGGQAIDGSMGVRSWETRFGTQVEMMDEVCRLTGFNAWKAAGVARDPWKIQQEATPLF